MRVRVNTREANIQYLTRTNTQRIIKCGRGSAGIYNFAACSDLMITEITEMTDHYDDHRYSLSVKWLTKPTQQDRSGLLPFSWSKA